MFDLNFIAKPGVQTESAVASWSFLQKRKEYETEEAPKYYVMGSKKSGANWENYGIAAFAIIIFAFIIMFINSPPKVSQSLVLNQVIDLIIESDYMNDLQLAEAHFKSDFAYIFNDCITYLSRHLT